jgi:hypothetical protein
MNFNNNTRIQNISCCGLAVFAGLGVYLGVGNALGVSKLSALLIGLGATVGILFLYRFLMSKAGSAAAVPSLKLMPLPGILVIIALNYCGMINLWKEMAIVNTPFLYYALLAAALFVLAGLRGAKGLLGACPIVALIIILIALFDTALIAAKAEPALFLEGIAKPAAQIAQGGAEITVALLAPGLLFLMLVFDQNNLKGQSFSGKDLAKGLILPVAYLLIELSRDLLLFGDLIALDKYPIIRTLKTVYFGVGVSRLEFLGITVLSFGALTAIMLEFIVLTKFTENIFHFNKKYLVGILAVLVVALSMVFYYSGQLVWVIAEAAAIILLLTYPLIMVAKRPRKKP